jgi:Fur family iron response transcriptional regulator
MQQRTTDFLANVGIQPSAQRVAIAEYILWTHDHPTADQVWQRVREVLPMISRATVYNTLNLFVREELIQALTLADGKIVFDPNVHPHHHFIEEGSGRIHDIPWEALEVRNVHRLKGYAVRDFHVVLRGRKVGRMRSP